MARPRSTPHPSYLIMIIKAVKEISHTKKTTVAIKKFITENYSVDFSNGRSKKAFNKSLYLALEYGLIVQKAGFNRAGLYGTFRIPSAINYKRAKKNYEDETGKVLRIPTAKPKNLDSSTGLLQSKPVDPSQEQDMENAVGVQLDQPTTSNKGATKEVAKKKLATKKVVTETVAAKKVTAKDTTKKNSRKRTADQALDEPVPTNSKKVKSKPKLTTEKAAVHSVDEPPVKPLTRRPQNVKQKNKQATKTKEANVANKKPVPNKELNETYPVQDKIDSTLSDLNYSDDDGSDKEN